MKHKTSKTIEKNPRETPPAETPQERRDAAENRAQILRAARQLFAKQGPSATSMAEIARRAGVGQGTLYRRYTDKGELCAALLKENASELQTELQAYVTDARANQVAALAQLRHILGRLGAFNEENASLLNEMWIPNHKRKAYSNSFYTFTCELVCSCLQQAVAQGECAPMNTELTAELVLAPMGILLYRHMRNHGYSETEICQRQWELTCKGLRAE